MASLENHEWTSSKLILSSFTEAPVINTSEAKLKENFVHIAFNQTQEISIVYPGEHHSQINFSIITELLVNRVTHWSFL